MNLKIAFIVGTLSLSISAFAEPAGPGAPAPAGVPGTGPADPHAPDAKLNPHPLTDAQIVQIVETTNDSEIAAARMEKNKGKSKDVKDFAQAMIDQHSKNNKELKMLTKKLQMAPEKTPMSDKIHSEARAASERMEKMKGRDLDRAYVDKQVEAHQHVLNKLDQELIPQAKNDDLKALLQDTRTTVAQHLAHAQAIQKTVKGQTDTDPGAGPDSAKE